MSLSAFLMAVFEHGRVEVPPLDANSHEGDLDRVRSMLEARAQSLALGIPYESPTLAMEAAVWAAQKLFQASQLAVYRELDAAAINQLLSANCPAAPPASRHWSVDLTFVFLPDLILVSRSASEHDPLVAHLLSWATEWPLSSVGVAGVRPRNVHEIATHSGLLQLYVDRILAKKDASRLDDEKIRAAVYRSLGAYVSQWPEAAKRLESEQPPAANSSA
jgi:hypothetical protein